MKGLHSDVPMKKGFGVPFASGMLSNIAGMFAGDLQFDSG